MSINKKQQEFIRFCIVGAVCTMLDALIYYTLRTMISYQVALICGYVLSLAVNCLLTIRWTLQTLPNKTNIIGVMTAHLFNLFVMRMGMMWLFTKQFELDDRLAYIPTLAISIGTNFILIRFIIHALNKQDEKP